MISDVAMASSLSGRPEIQTSYGSKQRWDMIRKVTTVRKSNKTSLTDEEEIFLSLLEEQKKCEAKNPTTPGQGVAEFREIHDFGDVVKVALARERLRNSLMKRLSKLTKPETRFLTNIVNNENATIARLERAEYVLRTDPLFQVEDDPKFVPENNKNNKDKKDNEEIGRSDIMKGPRIVCDTVQQLHGSDVEIVFQKSSLFSFDMGKVERELYGVDLSKPKEFSRQAWKILKEKPSEFLVLGTQDNDESVTPHVLSPPIMDSLRSFLPNSVAHDNFWLKYSMNRDGASLQAMYNTVRNSSRSLLAIETQMGEVFGAYVSSPWRDRKGFYGSCESFVWRLNESRFMPTSSIEEQAKLERNIDVFPWSQENRNIQLSNNSKLIIGGGKSDVNDIDGDKWGMSIIIDEDIYRGSSSPCITYRSPSLTFQDEGIFNITNAEIWTFTPCFDTEKAEELELGRMFVLSHFED